MHFFLHGGRSDVDSENNKKFFQNTCHDGNKILIFPFALDKSEWDELCIKYEKRWMMYNPDKRLSFACAKPESLNLIKQIQESNVLFFCGGPFPKWHLEVLDKIENLRALLQDKIIVGVSAGALIRSKVYYSPRYEKIRTTWNGRLNIKMMVHRWANRHPWLSKEERLKLLEDYWEKLPIYKIPEQEYIEFNI